MTSALTRVGIIGLGDMGFGMAGNLLKAGFAVSGYDLDAKKLQAFTRIGGSPASSAKEAAERSEIVFVMVLDAGQAKAVILGKDGILDGLSPSGIVIITATIGRTAVREIGEALGIRGIRLLDSPVSGGRTGAEAGALTLMIGGDADTLEECRPVLNAVAAHINHVGRKAGDGQTVKHVLSALTGACYVGIFEALVLGAKARLDMDILCDVIKTSTVGNALFRDSSTKIIDRNFRAGGSKITTMHKDLSLALQMARENGVPMPMTSVAMELFQAGLTVYPEEDNWSIVKILEGIAGAKVCRG